MPVYKLQGPDGKVYTIEGPEGATADQLGAFVQSQGDERQQRVAAQQAADRKLYDPTAGMSTFEKGAAGLGKAIVDTGRGLGQMVGLVSRKDVEEARERDAPLMGTTAGMVGNIAGNVGMALAPGGVALGAGKALSAVPAAGRVAQALMTGGKAVMAPTSIPAALGVGAAQGAIQPSISTEETLKNAGIGAAASAALPTLVRLGQVGKAAIDPFSDAGQARIMGRALQTAAGSSDDAATATRNLRDAAAPFVGPTPEGQTARTMMGEIVPGSIPTTGQAAGVPSIAALERTAVATDPTAGNLMVARQAAQNEARREAVQGVAGTGGKREFFEANRKATADDLYAQARRHGIDPAAITPEAQANIASFQQRVPDDVLARARELAKIEGVNMDNETSVQGLHWVKKAIDSKISTAMTSGDKEMARAYQGLQTTLLKGMDEISPAYGEARRTFGAMSKPINEMQVAQQVADTSINPLTGAIAPQAFARALSDKTAARVTGMKNATLENTMSPGGLNQLERVKEDLARSVFAQNAGRGPGSDTIQKLAYSNMMQQSGLPAWATALPRGVGVGGVLQRIGDVGYKSANQEMSAKLAQALLNPQDAAALMEAGTVTPQVRMLIEALRRGGAGVGAATPALLNSVAGVPRVDVNLDLLNSEGRK